jgi:hypothetical protein
MLITHIRREKQIKQRNKVPCVWFASPCSTAAEGDRLGSACATHLRPKHARATECGEVGNCSARARGRRPSSRSMAVIGTRDGEATALPLLLPREKEEVMPWRQWVREVGRLGYLALPMVVGHLPDVLPPSSVIIATSVTTVSIFFLFFTSMIGIEQDER